MKNINIISEAIYKGQHKLVNQGAFVNFSDLIDDIFACDGLTCACNTSHLNKSDIFIRKAYLRQSRKKPGANWMSLEQMVKEVYNCCAGTTLCADKSHAQWWITSDVIRPKKTIETINFTTLIVKTLTCCQLLNCCAPNVSPSFYYVNGNWSGAGVTNQTTFENFLTSKGYSSINVTNFSLVGTVLSCNLTADFAGTQVNYYTLPITEVRGLGQINATGFNYNLLFTNPGNTSIKSNVSTFNITAAGQLNNATIIYLHNNIVSTFRMLNYNPTNTASEIYLTNNAMTAASYSDMLLSVNTWPTITNSSDVRFTGNPISVLGTALETTLVNKGYAVYH
jgi:hypothetical protein